MKTVAKKSTPREIPPGFPPDLKPIACLACGHLVILVGRVDRKGRQLHAVELAPPEAVGNVALQTALTGCWPTPAPCAYEVSNATPYRWHEGHCSPLRSFTGQGRARKVRT